MIRIRVLIMLFALAGVILGACGASANAAHSRDGAKVVLPTSQQLTRKLLRPSDVGTGWQQVSLEGSASKAGSFGCKALGSARLRGVPHASELFVTASGGIFSESVEAYSNAAAQYRKGLTRFAKCGKGPVVFPEPDGGSSVATLAPITVPRLGDQSAGYSLAVTIASYPLVIRLVFIREAHLVLGVAFGMVGHTVSGKSLISYAREALAKATGESVTGV